MLSNRVAVVLSAMSGNTKREGTTSRLLEAAEEVLRGNPDGYKGIVVLVKDHHMKTAKEAIADQGILAATLKDIEDECTRLGSFLEAAEVRVLVPIGNWGIGISIGGGILPPPT